MSIVRLLSRELPPPATYQAYNAPAVPTEPPESKSDSGISALSAYVPTEIITIYIFGSSLVPTVQVEFPAFTQTNLYFSCIFLTPAVCALLFFGIKGSSRRVRSYGIFGLPLWTIFSSTLAFSVWGLAVPGSGLVTSAAASALAGFGALIVSILLDIAEKTFKRR